MTEKEILEQAFRALDELAGRQVKSEAEIQIPGSYTLSRCTSEASRPPEIPPEEPVWMDWYEWKAAALNRFFKEQGMTGQPGRITAKTVEHGERGRK